MIFGGQTLLFLDVLFLKNKKIVKYSKILIAAATILRCIQLIFFTMENTGFFIAKYKTAGMILSFLILGLIACPFIFSLKGKRQPTHPPANYQTICGAAFLVAFAILIEVLTNGFANVISPFLIYPYRVFGILAAAAFAAYGCLGFVKNFNFLRGFMVLVVLFGFFRLIVTFSCYSSLAGVTDSYFDIFMQCSQLCFLLFFAKSVCLIKTEDSCFAVLPTAMLTIGFTAVNVIPKLLMYCIGKSELVHPSPTYLFTNLALGIFAAIYAYRMFSIKNFDLKRPSTIILSKKFADVSDDSFLV